MTNTAPPFTAELREVQPQRYLGKRVKAPLDSVGSAVQAGFAELYQRLASTANQPVGPPFLISQLPKDGFLDMELGAPCETAPEPDEDFEAGMLPGGKVAVTVYRGPYDTLAQVYPRLAEWIGANRLTIAGPPREVYLSPPGEEPVTEVVWPVR